MNWLLTLTTTVCLVGQTQPLLWHAPGHFVCHLWSTEKIPNGSSKLTRSLLPAEGTKNFSVENRLFLFFSLTETTNNITVCVHHAKNIWALQMCLRCGRRRLSACCTLCVRQGNRNYPAFAERKMIFLTLGRKEEADGLLCPGYDSLLVRERQNPSVILSYMLHR